jgi:hypothetical protein
MPAPGLNDVKRQMAKVEGKNQAAAVEPCNGLLGEQLV